MQKALGFSTLMRLKPDAIPTIKAKKADTNDNNMEENLRKNSGGIYDYITIVNSEMSRSAYRKRNVSRIVNEAFHEFESQNKADQEELTKEVKPHMVESSTQTDFVSCEACNHPNNAFYYSNANDEEIVSDTDSITDDSSDEDYIAAEDSDFESDVEKNCNQKTSTEMSYKFVLVDVEKLIQLFSIVGVAMEMPCQYYIIANSWKTERRLLLDEILSRDDRCVNLGGDGRCDSPGFCAKFGAYTVMDLDTGKVVAIQIVQSNEVGSSNAMEKRNCCEFWIFLMLWEDYPEIKHFLDIWHISKSLSKKIDVIAKQKEYKTIDVGQVKSGGNWERVVKQRPATGKYPNRYDATLSYQGQKFRSAKAVFKYCDDNDIDYSTKSVKKSFQNTNPYVGMWDIQDVGDGGIDIIREKQGMKFSQTSYIEEISKRLNNVVLKAAEPFKVGFDLSELNLDARHTRPDICVAINILARYNAKPRLVHWNCMMHLWSYVVSTKDKCIHLIKTKFREMDKKPMNTSENDELMKITLTESQIQQLLARHVVNAGASTSIAPQPMSQPANVADVARQPGRNHDNINWNVFNKDLSYIRKHIRFP
uniref:Uncharacterized protein n=1 Tax=Strigamia maritima TaxID=126957 RepID=T1ILK1_STRMM